MNIDLRGLAEQLGLMTGTQWMLTAFPAWMLLLVPFILSIGFYTVLRVCVELRAPRLYMGYKGHWPGEAFLSFAIGLLMVGMAFYASPVVSPFWRSLAWNILTIIVVLGLTGTIAAIEYGRAIKYRKYRFAPDDVYTLYQLHTPTALGHRVSTLVLSYLFMKVGVVALCTGGVPVTLKLAAIVLLSAWVVCVIKDNSGTRPELENVHPVSRAWFQRPKALATLPPFADVRPAAPAAATTTGGSAYDRPGSTVLETETDRWDRERAFTRPEAREDVTRTDLTGVFRLNDEPVPPRAAPGTGPLSFGAPARPADDETRPLRADRGRRRPVAEPPAAEPTQGSTGETKLPKFGA